MVVIKKIENTCCMMSQLLASDWTKKLCFYNKMKWKVFQFWTCLPSGYRYFRIIKAYNILWISPSKTFPHYCRKRRQLVGHSNVIRGRPTLKELVTFICLYHVAYVGISFSRTFLQVKGDEKRNISVSCNLFIFPQMEIRSPQVVLIERSLSDGMENIRFDWRARWHSQQRLLILSTFTNQILKWK